MIRRKESRLGNWRVVKGRKVYGIAVLYILSGLIMLVAGIMALGVPVQGLLGIIAVVTGFLVAALALTYLISQPVWLRQPLPATSTELTEFKGAVTNMLDIILERIRWDDLRSVEIMTSSDGPLVTDVVWVLSYGDSEALFPIPMGVSGEDKLLERLQTLPGFDNEAVIQAMSSVENARFLCWERPSN